MIETKNHDAVTAHTLARNIMNSLANNRRVDSAGRLLADAVSLRETHKSELERLRKKEQDLDRDLIRATRKFSDHGGMDNLSTMKLLNIEKAEVVERIDQVEQSLKANGRIDRAVTDLRQHLPTVIAIELDDIRTEWQAQLDTRVGELLDVVAHAARSSLLLLEQQDILPGSPLFASCVRSALIPKVRLGKSSCRRNPVTPGGHSPLTQEPWRIVAKKMLAGLKGNHEVAEAVRRLRHELERQQKMKEDLKYCEAERERILRELNQPIKEEEESPGRVLKRIDSLSIELKTVMEGMGMIEKKMDSFALQSAIRKQADAVRKSISMALIDFSAAWEREVRSKTEAIYAHQETCREALKIFCAQQDLVPMNMLDPASFKFLLPQFTADDGPVTTRMFSA